MNEYRITNVANDGLVSAILQEVEREIKGNKDDRLQVVESEKQSLENKGICIGAILLAVAESIAAAVIYDLLKNVVKRFRKVKEYNPDAVIEIEYTNGQEHTKIKITLNDIFDK